MNEGSGRCQVFFVSMKVVSVGPPEIHWCAQVAEWGGLRFCDRVSALPHNLVYQVLWKALRSSYVVIY